MMEQWKVTVAERKEKMWEVKVAAKMWLQWMAKVQHVMVKVGWTRI